MAHLGVCQTLEDRVQETRVAHVHESCSMGSLIVDCITRIHSGLVKHGGCWCPSVVHC